jgi:hypothetical protein
MRMPRLRAPQEHGGVLAIPPLDEAGSLLPLNQARLKSNALRMLGRPLQELGALAKQEARTAAISHLQTLGLSASVDRASMWLVTGHQPELFHPGVWVKNFATFGLARRHGLTPLHVIIDNDAVKSTSIRVPDLHARPLRLVAAPYDHGLGPLPYEDCPVHDEESFARFPAVVHERLAGAGYEPLVQSLWNHARVLTPQTSLLGMRLAGARRRLEEEWGCHNLEAPLSRLCQTEAFAWFVCHLLVELPRFHAIHNDCLRGYRKQRRIRSRNHPVPELGVDEEWLEAPLWGWHAADHLRQRLFVRRTRELVSLRLSGRVIAELDCSVSPEKLVAGYRQIEAQSIKLRTRALTTTLFLRLCLADLFIHGIGGAAYDGLTDRIIEEFYGLPAPAFLTLSATLHLPLDGPGHTADELRRIRRELRDLWWNPDRHLTRSRQNAAAMLDRKRQLIRETPRTATHKRVRYEALRQLGEQLRPLLAAERQQALAAEARVVEQDQSERVARSREYAFCLYPEAELRPFMAQFTSQ